MKILQVLPYFCYGGAETMCRNLSLALKEKGHQVTAVSLYHIPTPIGETLEAAGIRVRYLGKRPGLDRTMVPRLAAVMKEERPDAVHTHLNVIKYAVPAARLAGIGNCVHTVHNVADKEAESALEGKINRFFFHRGWATPVALSRQVQRTVTEYYGLPEERAPVAFNGIDLSRCRRKESYALADGPVILHIGRFNEQKNHRGLLSAFALLRREIPDARLRLLGEGELMEKTRALASELGLGECVEFLGAQENVYPFLREADIFVLPSLYEGLPMTLIEAMGTGLPIAASPVGGVPDLIRDGVSGLLLPPEPRQTAAGWARLLRDQALREKLGRNALKSSEQYSAGAMAERYLEIYGMEIN